MPPAKPHFVVDPEFPNSKEILSIPRRYRLAAVGAWTVAGAWSVGNMTDGWVPVRVLRELGVTPAMADHLFLSTLWITSVDAGRVAHVWPTCEGRVSAIAFSNWSKWQKTKAEWTAGREANARRQRDFRNRMSGADTPDQSRVSNALQEVGLFAPGNLASETSNGVRNGIVEESRESGYLGSVSAVGSGVATAPAFPDHCPAHRYTPTPPPCGACRRQRIANESAATLAADVESVKRAADKTAEVRRRSNCKRCDVFGWQLDIWGDPLDPAVKCEHPGVT